MRKLMLVVGAVAAMLLGGAAPAGALADPFPTCIRECSPIPELPEIPGGPCKGALDGFC